MDTNLYKPYTKADFMLIDEFMGWEPRKDYFSYDECIMPIIDKIENLNLSEYFYQWEHFGSLRSNFMRIDVDIKPNYTSIWVELELDPAMLIAGGHFKNFANKKHAILSAIIQFITWYNKLGYDEE